MLKQIKNVLLAPVGDRISFVNKFGTILKSPDIMSNVIGQIQEWYEHSPGLSDCYSRLGLLYIDNDMNGESLQFFEKDIQLNRISWWGKLRHAEALYGAGEKDNAFKMIDNVYNETKEAVNGFASIGWGERKKDSSMAKKLFEKDALLGRISFGYQLNYGCLLMEMGFSEKAFEIIAAAYKASPKLTDGFSRLGWVVRTSGNRGKALELMERDSALGRQSPTWALNRAVLEAELELLDKAEATVSRAYEENTKLADGFSRLTTTCSNQKNMARLFEKDITTGRIYVVGLTLLLKNQRTIKRLHGANKFKSLCKLICQQSFSPSGNPDLNLLLIICRYHAGAISLDKGLSDLYPLMAEWHDDTSSPQLSRRIAANEQLLQVYDHLECYEEMLIYAERLWWLSRHDIKFFSRYVVALEGVGRFEDIRKLYWETGVSLLMRGSDTKGMAFLDKAFSIIKSFTKENVYPMDHVLSDIIGRVADKIAHKAVPENCGRCRVILFVAAYPKISPGNSPIRVLRPLIRFHNRKKFSLAFVMARDYDNIATSDDGKDFMEFLLENNCELIAPRLRDPEHLLKETAEAIGRWNPDVMITTTFYPSQQYVTALCKPPKLVNLIIATPSQCSAPSADFAISFDKRLIPDTLSNVAQIKLRLPADELIVTGKHMRSDFGIPDDAFVVATGGVSQKFSSPALWEAFTDLLRREPRVRLLCLGFDREAVNKYFPADLSAEVGERMMFLGFRDDYREILGMSDLYIDSYLGGGGLLLMDVIANGIPVISFKTPKSTHFDQRLWFLNDYHPGGELLVNHDDLAGTMALIADFVHDGERLKRVSKHFRAWAERNLYDATGYVREIENILWEIAAKSE